MTEYNEMIRCCMESYGYNIITRNLKEIFGKEEDIKKILKERPLKIYWGTAPTGRIHIGYFIPILKIADFLKANCQVKILIADLHAFLDNKSDLVQLNRRTKYYTKMIKTILTSLEINIDKLSFVRGTDFQLEPKYTMDMYKMMSITTVNDAKHSGSEVVKQDDNPKINGLIYPSLQALDEVYLDVDAQLGGIDQRKIFCNARTFLPKIGYKKCFHFMTEMLPGLSSGLPSKEEDNNEIDNKMSSSKNGNKKIDLLDGKNAIKKKINKTYCLEGDIDNNSCLEILKMVIFPILELKLEDLIIPRKEEHGGELEYETYQDVENDFKECKLHPCDLKLATYHNLNLILEPIRKVLIVMK